MKALKRIAATTAVSGLALGGLAVAPAGAQEQSGLVNVAIDETNVIVNPQVGVNAAVPIGIVANICDVNAAVIGSVVDEGGTTQCDGDVNQRTRQGLRNAQRFMIDN